MSKKTGFANLFKPKGLLLTLAYTIATGFSITAMSACASKQAVHALGNIDGEWAYETLSALSGPHFQGRQAGSAGGRLAADFILGTLKNTSLSVDTFTFTGMAAFNEGPAKLTIQKDGMLTEFIYREDFREVIRGGYQGGEAAGPLFYYGDLDADIPAGAAVLVPAAFYNPDDVERFKAAGAAILLPELKNGSPVQKPLYAGFRTKGMHAIKTGMIILGVSTEAFDRLEAVAGGASVLARSPVNFDTYDGMNILGAWNGNGGDFNPSVMLMAHYDHVGSDGDGNYFPGALDNASGVALVLAMAMATAKDQPAADIAFLFADAEESGLIGALAFVSEPRFPLDGVQVINVDMVGSISEVDYSLLVVNSKGEKLASLIAAALQTIGISANVVPGNDEADHAPFAWAGSSALTINELDQSAYHTRFDTPAGISVQELDSVGDVIYSTILDLATD